LNYRTILIARLSPQILWIIGAGGGVGQAKGRVSGSARRGEKAGAASARD